MTAARQASAEVLATAGPSSRLAADGKAISSPLDEELPLSKFRRATQPQNITSLG